VSPLVDPSLFQDRGFATGLLAALTLFGGVASSFFVLALYLQQGRGLAPLPSGLVFSTLALAFTVTSLSAGRIARRLGRPPLVPGALGMAIGLGALALAVERIGVRGSVAWLLVPLLIDGGGMGLVMAPLAATVLAGLPGRHAGAAAGVLVTAQQFANALGVALVGLVYFGALPQGGQAGAFVAGVACLAALALALAALVWRLQRG
jgi:predicted MFS family arabinose efflux permease